MNVIPALVPVLLLGSATHQAPATTVASPAVAYAPTAAVDPPVNVAPTPITGSAAGGSCRRFSSNGAWRRR